MINFTVWNVGYKEDKEYDNRFYAFAGKSYVEYGKSYRSKHDFETVLDTMYKINKTSYKNKFIKLKIKYIIDDISYDNFDIFPMIKQWTFLPEVL